MPLSDFRQDKHTRLGIWQITETESQLWDELGRPEIYQKELDTFVSQKRRVEFLAVRRLLLEMTGECLSVAYEPDGRPYLPNTTVRLSITHTQGYAAVLLSSQCDVAIDIEKRSEKVLRLKEKFLNQQELDAVDPIDPLSYTLICWSAKESMFKIIPENEIDFKSHLLLSPFRVSETGSFSGKECRTSQSLTYHIFFESRASYVLTWIIGSS
ncbi:MAG: 4'-phosphopantetheinyl transferase family protein [Bacteroidales bacterium]